MGSTEINIGFNENSKVSSRVLKPPGGGHSNIFSPPETKSNPPRPKYNQQNSTNLNAVMGTEDPNIKSRGNEELYEHQEEKASLSSPMESKPSPCNDQGSNGVSSPAGGRVRVPPGGFSSGLW